MTDDVNVTVEPTDAQVTNEANVDKTYQQVIKNLIANGAKKLNSVRIKNVNITEKENYHMVSFTLNTSIPGFVSNDNGLTYVKGMTTTLFTSLYAIVGSIKEDEELAWLGNALLDSPKLCNLIFNGATMDVVQEDVAAGQEYVNPFSTRSDVEPQVFQHDTIINHVVKFKLGKTGKDMSNTLARMMMEEALKA